MLKANNSTLKTPEGDILLQGISFQVEPGMLAYFYGPNGIGKTSLIKAILGIGLKIDNLENTFRSYTYLPQIENKDFLLPIMISDISPTGPYLTDKERQIKWNKASGGQRKKALIEKVLQDDCELYILDEPYNHLDINSIEKVNQSIEGLLLKGKTIIMIGHKYPDIEERFIFKMDIEQWK